MNSSVEVYPLNDGEKFKKKKMIFKGADFCINGLYLYLDVELEIIQDKERSLDLVIAGMKINGQDFEDIDAFIDGDYDFWIGEVWKHLSEAIHTEWEGMKDETTKE